MLEDFYEDIISFISKKKLDTSYEAEIRFGSFFKSGFDQKISFNVYNNILNKYNDKKSQTSNLQIEIYKESQSDNSNINWRKIINLDNDNINFEIKNKISKFDILEYSLRISFSEETKKSSYKVPDDLELLLTRVKKLTRIDFRNFYLDCSKISQEGKEFYEIELEFKNIFKMKDFQQFEIQLKEIWLIINDSANLYTFEEKEQLNNDLGLILNDDEHLKAKKISEGNKFYDKNLVYRSTFVEPRNIKHKDISMESFFSKYGNYLLSYKIKGIRKALAIHKTGLWIFFPPKHFSLVIKAGENKLLDTLIKQGLYLFDGEIYNLEDGKTTFYIFDTLIIPNKQYGYKDVRKEDYKKRLSFAETFIRNIQASNNKNEIAKNEAKKISNVLTIKMREYIELDSIETFYEKIKLGLENTSKQEYETDGLIFTPVNMPYNIYNQTKKDNSRILEYIPDVIKWKDVEELTIDFIIDRVGELIKLYVSERGCATLFLGTPENPFTDVNVDHDAELTRNLPSGTVVEYKWNFEKNLFEPIIIRYDKSGANKQSVAISIWRDLMDPVTRDDITGETLRPVFHYHNLIKRELSNQLLKNGENQINFGAGKGGDVHKWKNIPLRDKKGDIIPDTGLIVAIEPNEDNFKELLRRVSSMGIEDQVIPLKTIGQDTKSITETVKKSLPGGKADVASLMLSLSFFWKSKKDLDDLVKSMVQNLKQKSKIIFLTIDGETLLKKFKKNKTYQINEKNWFTLNTRNKTNFNNEVLAAITESKIVGEQLEYLVFLDDLTSRLEKYGFELKMINYADDYMLSKTQKKFSELYTYGYYERV